MYPLQIYSTTPPFPANNTVFIAMSFDERFNYRLTHVIEPAIRSVAYKASPLDPVRLDAILLNDSIVSEIITNICSCRLVFADITDLSPCSARPHRSANVFYELGLSHAMRQPEEVIIFRSDSRPLDFDIAHIRIHSYSPEEDEIVARALVRDRIAQSLTEIDNQHRLLVQHLAMKLDGSGIALLVGLYAHLKNDTALLRSVSIDSQIVASAPRLYDLGLIRTDFEGMQNIARGFTGAEPEHQLTEIGEAVAEWLLNLPKRDRA